MPTVNAGEVGMMEFGMAAKVRPLERRFVPFQPCLDDEWRSWFLAVIWASQEGEL